MLKLAPIAEKYRHVNYSKPRGVSNRNLGLEWLRLNADDGVFYFADDDNSYDLELFEQMRTVQKVAFFPVGLIRGLGLSSPIVREILKDTTKRALNGNIKLTWLVFLCKSPFSSKIKCTSFLHFSLLFPMTNNIFFSLPIPNSFRCLCLYFSFVLQKCEISIDSTTSKNAIHFWLGRNQVSSKLRTIQT